MAQPDPPASATRMEELHAPRAAALRAAMTQLFHLSHANRRGSVPEADALAWSEAFAASFREALERGGAIRIEVQAEGLRWRGTEISGRDLVVRSQCADLHKEGLRAFEVAPGTLGEDLRHLAGFLALDWGRRGAFEGDIEAAAWRLGLSGVQFDLAVADDLPVHGRQDAPIEEEVDALASQLASEGVSGALPDLQAALGAALDRLRAIPPTQGPPSEPISMQHPRWRELRQLLDLVRGDQDASGDHVGLVVFESLRAAPTEEIARSLARDLLAHTRRAIAAGQPGLALDPLRRPLLLLDAESFPAFLWRGPLHEELRAVLTEEFGTAIREGLRENPEVESWLGPLFTLGQIAAGQDADLLAELGGSLPDRRLRQAIADALVIVADASGLALRGVLQRADERRAAVVLLALSRRHDPTLVEQILAHLSSPTDAVREATLVALRGHQSPRIKEVARQALHDTCPEVRLEALRYVAFYRDLSAADAVTERLRMATPDLVDEAELRATAIAAARILRQEVVPLLESIAGGTQATLHPDAPLAALHGLKAAGEPGRTALDRLGRTLPELRPTILELFSGGTP